MPGRILKLLASFTISTLIGCVFPLASLRDLSERSDLVYLLWQIEKNRLGEVYLRLGDLQKCNGNYQQAIQDYMKSLEIYSGIRSEDERVISEVRQIY